MYCFNFVTVAIYGNQNIYVHVRKNMKKLYVSSNKKLVLYVHTEQMAFNYF